MPLRNDSLSPKKKFVKSRKGLPVPHRTKTIIRLFDTRFECSPTALRRASSRAMPVRKIVAVERHSRLPLLYTTPPLALEQRRIAKAFARNSSNDAEDFSECPFGAVRAPKASSAILNDAEDMILDFKYLMLSTINMTLKTFEILISNLVTFVKIPPIQRIICSSCIQRLYKSAGHPLLS